MSVKDVTTNKVLAEYTYDQGNCLMNSATIGGRSKLEIEYDYLNNITSRKVFDLSNNNGLTYEETYKYFYMDGYEEMVISGGGTDKTSRLDYDGYEIYTKVNGVETTNTYDLSGNLLTSVTDDCTTKMEYNGLNLMTKVTKPKGGVYTYGYDMLGRNTSVKSPNGAVTNYSYDDSDRLVTESYPIESGKANGSKQYTYDNNGNVTSESISNNAVGSSTATRRTTNYSYDAKNNLIKVKNVDNNNKECYTEYEYDGVGNMLKMKAANGANVTSYAYNSLNQVTKITDPMGYYETYSYDNSGNLISKVDKNGVTLKYTYDALGKVTREYAAVGSTEVTRASYQYNISGNLIKSENSNGKFEMFYDDNRLCKMDVHQGSAYYRYYYNY